MVESIPGSLSQPCVPCKVEYTYTYAAHTHIVTQCKFAWKTPDLQVIMNYIISFPDLQYTSWYGNETEVPNTHTSTKLVIALTTDSWCLVVHDMHTAQLLMLFEL